MHIAWLITISAALLAFLIFGGCAERRCLDAVLFHRTAALPVSWSGAPVDNLWKSATFQANFMT
jgi:hypothetical protein